MVQGLAFLSKKSWHTKNLSNQEKVWMAEEKKKVEDAKTSELARQIQQEREQDELDEMAGKKRIMDRGIDWMYHGHEKQSEVAREDAEKKAEEYLLGKVYVSDNNKIVGDLEVEANEGVNAVIASAAAKRTIEHDDDNNHNNDNQNYWNEPTVAQRNEAFRVKMEDPMYAVSLQVVQKEKEIEKKRILYEKALGVRVTIAPKKNDEEVVDKKESMPQKKKKRSKHSEEKKSKRSEEKTKKPRKRRHRDNNSLSQSSSSGSDEKRKVSRRRRRDTSSSSDTESESDSRSFDRRRRTRNVSRSRYYSTDSDSERSRHRRRRRRTSKEKYRVKEKSSSSKKRYRKTDDSYDDSKDTFSSEDNSDTDQKKNSRSVRSRAYEHRNKYNNSSNRNDDNKNYHARVNEEVNIRNNQQSDRRSHTYDSRDRSGRSNVNTIHTRDGRDVDRKNIRDDHRKWNDDRTGPRSSPSRESHDDRVSDNKRYGLQQGGEGSSRNHQSTISRDLGPDKDLLRRKRELEQEQRRKVLQNDTNYRKRSMMTQEEREAAIREMERDAHIRSSTTSHHAERKRLIYNDNDEDTNNNKQKSDPHFIRKIAKHVHGVNIDQGGDYPSISQRIQQKRHTSQRPHDESFL